jgi:ferric-dicitrate binding protein FerR (iron transport regulator)
MIIENETYWNEIIGKYLSGNCSDQEARSLHQWLQEKKDHEIYFKEMEAIWKITDPGHIELPIDNQSAWNFIEKEINLTSTELQGGKKIKRLYVQIAAVAAIILLLIYNPFTGNEFFKSGKTTFYAASETEKRVEELPDGSKVWLNKNSRISFDQSFNPRHVKLEGEAFFEVAHDPDSPFEVMAGSTKTTVLGTKFNLRINPQSDVELHVTEGKVSFTHQEIPSEKQVVSKAQAAVYKKTENRITQIKDIDPNHLSWVTEKLVFDHLPLEEVIQSLERHFDIQVDVNNEGLLACDLKADFDHNSLEEIIQTIQFSLNCEILFEDNRYVISGNPCKIDE